MAHTWRDAIYQSKSMAKHLRKMRLATSLCEPAMLTYAPVCDNPIGTVVSSNGAARVGTGQGSMRSTKFQGTAGYVTRMSGGVGGRGREASSYPD